MHQSLLPGLYETIQVLQALDIRQGDDVLIIGPRGNWWTEIAMQLGARRIRVVGTIEERLAELDLGGLLCGLTRRLRPSGAKLVAGGWIPQGRPASGRMGSDIDHWRLI